MLSSTEVKVALLLEHNHNSVYDAMDTNRAHETPARTFCPSLELRIIVRDVGYQRGVVLDALKHDCTEAVNTRGRLGHLLQRTRGCDIDFTEREECLQIALYLGEEKCREGKNPPRKDENLRRPLTPRRARDGDGNTEKNKSDIRELAD